jgi:hypothetical protein
MVFVYSSIIKMYKEEFCDCMVRSSNSSREKEPIGDIREQLSG